MTLAERLLLKHPELMALNNIERNAILDIIHEAAWMAWRENDMMGVSYMDFLLPEKISRSNFDFWYNIKSKSHD